MLRNILLLIAGAAAGFVLSVLIEPSLPERTMAADVIAPRDLTPAEDVTRAEAQTLREERYASITTIEEMLALPGDFAETEALYTVAGREDSAGVQRLIFEAARIRSSRDRSAALDILFMRLTEIDPESAIALAASPAFEHDRRLPASVWGTLAQLDLDAALAAAAELPDGDRYRVAQYLFRGLRDEPAHAALRIESELGIAADLNSLSRLVRTVADESVGDAIALIESQRNLNHRRQLIGQLASHLARNASGTPDAYAGLLQSAADRRLFSQMFDNTRLAANPDKAVREYLQSPAGPQRYERAGAALFSLAQRNPTRALELLQSLPGEQVQGRFADTVLLQAAQRDPVAALDWFMSSELSDNDRLLSSLIAQVATVDPDLALQQSMAISDHAQRQTAVRQAISQVAQHEPSRAAAMLASVQDETVRAQASAQIAAAWANYDSEAAIAYAETLDPASRRQALSVVANTLARSDVDTAIAYMDRLDPFGEGQLPVQIARTLAEQRSIDDALGFASRYEGSATYGTVMQQIVDIAARSDPDRADDLIRRIADTAARDQALFALVARQARRDPVRSAGWVDRIDDVAVRRQATNQLVQNWYRNDPAGATAWIERLPRGERRDSAVAGSIQQLASWNLNEATRLVESIGDQTRRRQAKLMLAQTIAARYPDVARRMFDELDLSEQERRQYGQLLQSFGY